MARNLLGGFCNPGKPLPSNARNEIINLFSAGLGLSDIPQNMRVPKGAVHKPSDTIQSTRRLNHFLVEVKTLDDRWPPWSNWLALLPSALCRRFLMLPVNFRRINFVHRKNRFLSIYLQGYVYPIKERNVHVKNAIFIPRSFMREARWL